MHLWWLLSDIFMINLGEIWSTRYSDEFCNTHTLLWRILQHTHVTQTNFATHTRYSDEFATQHTSAPRGNTKPSKHTHIHTHHTYIQSHKGEHTPTQTHCHIHRRHTKTHARTDKLIQYLQGKQDTHMRSLNKYLDPKQELELLRRGHQRRWLVIKDTQSVIVALLGLEPTYVSVDISICM